VAQNKGQDSCWKDIPVTQGNGTSGFQYNFQESREDSQSKLLWSEQLTHRQHTENRYLSFYDSSQKLWFSRFYRNTALTGLRALYHQWTDRELKGHLILGAYGEEKIWVPQCCLHQESDTFHLTLMWKSTKLRVFSCV